MQYPDLHDAIARMKLARMPQEDGTLEDVLIFREHYTTDRSLYGKEVPRSKIPTESARPDYFYFCGAYVLQFLKYTRFYDLTRRLTDAEARAFSTQDLDLWAREQEIEIRGYSSKGSEPYTASVLIKWRDDCMRNMVYKGLSESDAAVLFFLNPRYTHKVLGVRGAPSAAKKKQNITKKSKIKDDARYRAVSNMIAYARIKAHKSGIYGEYGALDVFPNMFSLHGNVGAQNGDLFIPNVCPVLRIPLVWGENNKVLGAPRVWRKTNTLPFGPDNVAIMSKLAAWVIEGAYAPNRVNAALDGEMRAAWADWQVRHPFSKPETITSPQKPTTTPTPVKQP